MKIDWSVMLTIVLALIVYKLVDKFALSKVPGLSSYEY